MSHLSNRFSRQLNLEGVGSGTESMQDIPVRANEIRVYDRIVVENENNANSDARIVINRNGEILTLAYFANLTAGTPQVYDDEIIFTRDDEILEIRWTDVTANDNLRAWVYGYSKPII